MTLLVLELILASCVCAPGATTPSRSVQHNNLNSAAKQLLRNVAEGKRFELLL